MIHGYDRFYRAAPKRAGEWSRAVWMDVRKGHFPIARWGVVLVFLCILMGGRSALASDPGDKVGPGVREALEAGEPVAVVIALVEPAALHGKAFDLHRARKEVAGLQDDVLATLDKAHFRLKNRFAVVPALAGVIRSRAGLARLEAHPRVRRIDLDEGGSGSLAQSVPLIQADQWHDLGVTGEGVVVAVLDSGLDTDHDDLGDDLIHEECFLDTLDPTPGVGACPNGSERQSGAGAAEDDHGHGTNVTGIITSAGTVSSVGVAPDAGIVAIKVLDSSNSFYYFNEIVAALDFIIDNPQYGIQVINMSLSTSKFKSNGECDDEMSWNMAAASAINTLRANGVLTFAASGNSGSGTEMGSPACLSGVIAVGASDDDDIVADFTNSNSELDILAPGVSIVSTGRFNGLSGYSGTSQASPHAAGCAALLIEAGVATTPDEIEARLKESPVTLTDPDNGLSFPRIDCFSGALPVALAPLEAVADGDRVALQWRTLSEVDNAGFEVQHRVGGAYEAIGFVDGAGTVHDERRYAFTTEALLPGRHLFRLKQLNFDGTYAYSAEVAVEVAIPGLYYLSEAYPNPFNPYTVLSLSVQHAQRVRAEAFDILGRRVAVLFEGEVQPGDAHLLRFDAAGLESGNYLVRVTGEEFSSSKVVVLLK